MGICAAMEETLTMAPCASDQHAALQACRCLLARYRGWGSSATTPSSAGGTVRQLHHMMLLQQRLAATITI